MVSVMWKTNVVEIAIAALPFAIAGMEITGAETSVHIFVGIFTPEFSEESRPSLLDRFCQAREHLKPADDVFEIRP